MTIAPVRPPARHDPDDVRSLCVTAALCGAVFSTLALLAAYAGFVRTGYGRRLDNRLYDDLVIRPLPQFVHDTLLAVPAVVVLVALGCLVVSVRRGLGLPGVAAAALPGIAPLVADLLKFTWSLRDVDPLHYVHVNSFPSGHTAAAFGCVAALVLVVPARYRFPVAACAVPLAVLVGLLTVFAGWHRPGDVVGGVLLGLALGCLSAAWLAARRPVPAAAPGR